MRVQWRVRVLVRERLRVRVQVHLVYNQESVVLHVAQVQLSVAFLRAFLSSPHGRTGASGPGLGEVSYELRTMKLSTKANTEVLLAPDCPTGLPRPS